MHDLITFSFKNGNTPLLFAAERAFSAGVELLLRFKANVFAVQQNVYFSMIQHFLMLTLCFIQTVFTVLHLSAINEDIETIQLLLETNNSLVNLKDANGNTALHLSISHRKEHSLKTLFFFYPDLTVMNDDGETPLYFAAKCHAWNLFILLCNNGAKVDLYHPKGVVLGDSLLVMAFRDHSVDALRLLLEHGCDWHDIDSKVMLF